MNPTTFNFCARFVWLLTFGIIRISGTLRNRATGEVIEVGIRPKGGSK